MNYPLESLAIIAPILFIIMMVGFPIIGIFGGWKRAVYWGGGNLLFYIIGMLIWRFAGASIVAPIAPAIQKAFSDLQGLELEKVSYSIVAPAFFMLVVLLGNLILLINYYTWFKKKVGIGKTKIVKQKNRYGVVAKTEVPNKVQLTGSKKAFNMIVGGLAMTALMLPTTFAFTEAVYFTTTSSKTRQANNFSNSIYNAVVTTGNSVSWFSYYNVQGSVAKDYDALYGSLSLAGREIAIVLPNGETFTGNAWDAVAQTFDKGFGNIYQSITALDDEGKIEGVVDQCNGLVDSWNSIIAVAIDDITPVFNSANATDVLQQLISSKYDTPPVVTSNDIQNYIGEDSAFEKALDAYTTGQYTDDDGNVVEVDDIHKVEKQIEVSEECYNNIALALYNTYQFEDSVTEEEKQSFKDRMYQLVGLLFTY